MVDMIKSLLEAYLRLATSISNSSASAVDHKLIGQSARLSRTQTPVPVKDKYIFAGLTKIQEERV